MLSHHDIIGYYFFEDEGGTATTVTLARYVAVLGVFVTKQFENLSDLDRSRFRQDTATVHTTGLLMVAA